MNRIKKFEQYITENHDYKERCFYDDILSGHEAPNGHEDALDRARGLDWGSMECQEQRIAYLEYVDTANGIDVWYNYGSDDYYFSSEED